MDKDTVVVVGGVTAAIAVVFGAIWTFASFNIVGQNEGIVFKNDFKGTIRNVNKSGVAWKTPFWEDAIRYPKHQIGFKSQQQGNTKDNVQTTFNIRVLYKIINGVSVYRNIGNLDEESIKSRIESYVSKSVDSVSNKRDYTDIRSNISAVSSEITKVAKELVAKNIKGLEVQQVIIDNVDAPDSIDNAIAEKQAQKQRADASAYEKQKAKNEADAQEIKKSVGQDQQKIEICARDTRSYACLPENVTVIGATAITEANKKGE